MVAVVVPDYDEAIAHYTQAWGFKLLEDSVQTPEKRWVRVAPPGSSCALLLAKAATPAQEAAIGQQTGGRVFLFLHCEDLDADLVRLAHHGCHPEALAPYFSPKPPLRLKKPRLDSRLGAASFSLCTVKTSMRTSRA